MSETSSINSTIGFLSLVSEDLVSVPELAKSGKSDLTFGGLLKEPGLSVSEDGGKMGCGGHLWPAGDLLSRYLIRYGIGKRSRVVELGSGTGLAGLALGYSEREKGTRDMKIWVTDQQNMLSLMQKNTNLNQLQDLVIPEVLNWGEDLPKYIKDEKIDTVLAADCVYLESAFPLLEKTLLDLCDKDTFVLMSYKKRRKADSKFFKAIRKNFTIIEIKDFPEYETFHRDTVYLFQLVRKEKVGYKKSN